MKLAKKFQRVLLCAQFGLLTLGANAIAAGPGKYNPYPNQPGYGQPNYGYQQDINQMYHHVKVIHKPHATILEVKVDKWLPRGGSLVKLKKMFKLGQYQGKSIKRVVVKASSARGYGQASLLINGQPVGAGHTLPTYPERKVWRLYENQNTLGADINRLQMSFQGKIFVEKFRIALEKNYVQTISKPMYKNVYGSDMIKVRKELNIGQSAIGAKVHSISVTGVPTQRGGAWVQLLVNNSPVGQAQKIGRRNGHLHFQMPYYGQNVLGEDIKSIKLQVTGYAQLNSLSAQVEGLSNGYGGGYGPGNGGYHPPKHPQPPIYTPPGKNPGPKTGPKGCGKKKKKKC